MSSTAQRWVRCGVYLLATMPALAQAQQLPSGGFAHGTQATDTSQPPRIQLCAAAQVVGLWKMEQVYEVPPGAEMQRFKTQPERYLELHPNGGYQGITGSIRFADYFSLKTAMDRSLGADIWQYVVDSKGLFYIYKNRVLTTTFHCGIAMETKGGYSAGDMVLTPATAEITQSFRHYRKITLP